MKKNWKAIGVGVGIVGFVAAMNALTPKQGDSMTAMSHGPAGPSPIALAPPQAVPAEHQAGVTAFQSVCAECHGQWGQGTDHGPPLVHDYYKPSHHADYAFHQALRRGVRAHHWRFGNMPPQPKVTMQQANDIVGFVRWWQRENGIL
ncbi:putative cytochrome c class I [Magnetofaba australis IT-1]|uniref:Putative cytochrome c class I n=1 Tax=Magnetofaba australis IT-1 TaxID=1434232 RepID=A0A1Y2K437_9PROT|nr:putative cytochrome c class I [Magnetofaba australis IT-1]